MGHEQIPVKTGDALAIFAKLPQFQSGFPAASSNNGAQMSSTSEAFLVPFDPRPAAANDFPDVEGQKPPRLGHEGEPNFPYGHCIAIESGTQQLVPLKVG